MSHARHLLALSLSLAGVLAAGPAAATHLYSGTIRHRVPDPVNAPNKVEIVLDLGSRVTIFNNDPATLSFGDGTNATLPGVEIASPALVGPGAPDYTVLRYVFSHTYAGPGAYFPSYQSCCMASSFINGNDAAFFISGRVDLAPADSGSAVASVPPKIFMQTGGLREYRIAARDPDGAPVSCRFPTAAESYLATSPPQIPGGAGPTISNDPDGCMLSWDTTGGTAGQLYGVSVVLETPNGAQGSVTVANFAVNLVAGPPPTCDGTGLFDAELGQPFTLPFLGKSLLGSDLMLASIGLFGVQSPPDGSLGPSPFTSQVSITPLPGEEGLHAMNVIYRDTAKIYGDCSAVVNVKPCPSFGQPCSAGVGECLALGSQYCSGGQVLCSAVAGSPVAETCNGLDDDCDGVIDGPFGLGAPCQVGLGECAASGVIVCDANGGAACDAVPGAPGAEVCDGVDNDCNGVVDDNCGMGGQGGTGGASGGQGGAQGGTGGASGGQGGAQGGTGGANAGQGGAQGGTGGANAGQGGAQGGSGGAQGGSGGANAGQGGDNGGQGGTQGGSDDLHAGAAGSAAGEGGSGAAGSGNGSSGNSGANNDDDPSVAGCTCAVPGPRRDEAPIGALLAGGMLAHFFARRRRASRQHRP